MWNKCVLLLFLTSWHVCLGSVTNSRCSCFPGHGASPSLPLKVWERNGDRTERGNLGAWELGALWLQREEKLILWTAAVLCQESTWIALATVTGRAEIWKAFLRSRRMRRLKIMIKFKKEMMKVQSELTVTWFVYQRAQSSHFRGYRNILHFEPG